MKEALLRGTGFDFEVHEPPPFLILSIEGEGGNGKTDLALTAPDPILLQGLDGGHRGVVEKFQKAGKRIGVAEYDYQAVALPKGATLVEEQKEFFARDIWGKFERDYRAAIAAGARTIIWDTASEVWEVIRLANFGKLTQVPETMYGVVNEQYRGLVRLAEKARINLLLLHQLKEEYKNEMVMTPQGPKEKGKRTGNLVRAGMNKVGYLVDSFVRNTFTPPKWKKDGELIEAGVFHTTILKCRDEMKHMVGMVLDDTDFMTLATMLRPSVESSKWYAGSSGIIRLGVLVGDSAAGDLDLSTLEL